MKNCKLILLSLLLVFTTLEISAEVVNNAKITKLEQSLQKEIKAREALKSELASQKKLITHQSHIIDSLREITEQNSNNIKSTAEQLGLKISETNTSLEEKADFSALKSRTIWGSVLFFILAALGGLLYFILHKRITKGDADVDALKQKAEKLNEDILNKFSLEMVEMQKISSSLDALLKNPSVSTNGKTGEPDHSLIKTIADRITFMEMTLFKMDPKVRGYKQLSRSISQMKDNLLANGYEIVDMLGKPYNNGMKVTANFIEDEDIEQGKQIITGIIKPQINYNGIMIQSAQITVSQNI